MLPSQSSSVTADLLLSICEGVEDDPELSAVWGSSLPVSSQVLKFQAMLFEEMGDDLEDISDVEIQIESSSFTEITRSTRRKTGVRSARNAKSTRSGYTYP